MKSNFFVTCPNCDVDIDLSDEDNFKDELLDDTQMSEMECFNCKSDIQIITKAVYSFSAELEEEDIPENMKESIEFIGKIETKKAPVSDFKIIKEENKSCCRCDGHGEECQEFAWIYCDIRSFFDEDFGGDCGEVLSCNHFKETRKSFMFRNGLGEEDMTNNITLPGGLA